jgi:hypothetical protein
MEIQAATLSFPLAPHNPENPKTATLYAVLTDPATGAKLEKSIALDVTDEERAALLERAEAAIAEVL